jgi:hypothetical protein
MIHNDNRNGLLLTVSRLSLLPRHKPLAWDSGRCNLQRISQSVCLPCSTFRCVWLGNESILLQAPVSRGSAARHTGGHALAGAGESGHGVRMCKPVLVVCVQLKLNRALCVLRSRCRCGIKYLSTRHIPYIYIYIYVCIGVHPMLELDIANSPAHSDAS